jgi:hypothetical protein
MLAMKKATLMFVCMVALGACNRGGAGSKSSGAPSPFDKRWDALAMQGAQAIRIADDQGAALMDNVLGAQTGAVAMAPFMAESMKGGARPGTVPERLDQLSVQKVVRQYLPGVKSCYQRLTSQGDTRTGKAIVSFQIAGNGHVEAVSIDAPAFDGSQLATCIDSYISHWVFPVSRTGAPATSYPLVFG